MRDLPNRGRGARLLMKNVPRPSISQEISNVHVASPSLEDHQIRAWMSNRGSVARPTAGSNEFCSLSGLFEIRTRFEIAQMRERVFEVVVVPTVDDLFGQRNRDIRVHDIDPFWVEVGTSLGKE